MFNAIFFHLAALVLGLALSFWALFIAGNIQDVYVYYELYENAYVHYLMFVSFLVISATFSQYYFWSKLFFKKVLLRTFIVAGILASLAGYFAASFGSHRGSDGWGTSFLYIFFESNLSPIIGISFFHMDWVGWVVTFVLYFSAVFCAPFLFLIKRMEEKRVLSSRLATIIPLSLFVFIFTHDLVSTVLGGILMTWIDIVSLVGIFLFLPYFLYYSV